MTPQTRMSSFGWWTRSPVSTPVRTHVDDPDVISPELLDDFALLLPEHDEVAPLGIDAEARFKLFIPYANSVCFLVAVNLQTVPLTFDCRVAKPDKPGLERAYLTPDQLLDARGPNSQPLRVARGFNPRRISDITLAWWKRSASPETGPTDK